MNNSLYENLTFVCRCSSISVNPFEINSSGKKTLGIFLKNILHLFIKT